jgi:hypothetical protein
MTRLFSMFAALVLAAVAVSSACVAGPLNLLAASSNLTFRLQPAGTSDRIKASFEMDRGARDDTDWSTTFAASEFAGLDLGQLRGRGSSPIGFALTREAGRLDCSGTGGDGYANGSCRFTANAAFANLLASRGMARPTEEQAFALMAVNAHAELIEALAAARYPMPSMSDFIAMSALDVTGGYIRDLARVGYRPQTTGSLIEFKALNISPAWIGGFASIGYANVPADQLVQLKALDITPEFVAGFERIGYHRLPVDTLVELRALDVTPEFIQSLERAGINHPSPEQAVRIKVVGIPPHAR